MKETGKNCVVFFGSQTGNAHDIAEKLAKEGHARFGLETLVADLDDYDYDTLTSLTGDKVAMFVLSSYGEGEPTDNAEGFYQFITHEDPTFSVDTDGGAPLQKMRYAAFGLGNSTYEHYNAVVRKVDASLQQLGACRVGAVGEGDDAKGTMEDSFLSWKEDMWSSLRSAMNLDEHNARCEPAFVVSESQSFKEFVYLGERSSDELLGTRNSIHGPHNPAIVNVFNSEELFNSKDRNCVHMELDIGGSCLSYQTGDHVAIWPVNANVEVDRFLRVFGLLEKRHTTINISAVDSTANIPIPSPTTYDAAARYYLEIAGPVSRQSLATLADFAADADQKSLLLELSKDSSRFRDVVSSQLLNWAQLIETISTGDLTCPVPFAVLLECVRPLQPRYYSISSSSIVQPHTVSITAVVESTTFPSRQFRGVASNFLLALKHQQNREKVTTDAPSHDLSGPRDKYELSLPIHIRRSTFRLPEDNSRPIIMIGPGTGVAPFRAFIQERAARVQDGVSIGKCVLFYGCRTESEDFIYRNEWEEHKGVLGNSFELYTAFSRQTSTKFYVQHLLVEHANHVLPLLLDGEGYLYICGDTRMARESSGRFQEDVW
ncbi:NADPH--cytochrome P450 reductase [Pleurostoma richardsiae]|uniref:NADPH--hemoprotein reductase n=1 Tax=Pleurostoma richardsiae TaxID=41990 RepID=A0AA38RCF7_9PEZI|nr:NADPH--cytochrome P450 reductase [Pleurostoma richardsiae]